MKTKEMKKILMLIPAWVTLFLVCGNGMISTASAQEVSTEESDRPVVYFNIAEIESLDSILSVRIPPIAAAETLQETLESPAEEVAVEAAVDAADKPYENVMVKRAGRDRYGRYTIQCAAHVNGRLGRAGYYSQGHAYQILTQFPSVINGYNKVTIPSLSKLSWENRVPAVLDMHRQAADYVKENLDISKLVPGAYYVVNMYYTTSPYMLQFFYAARKQGTRNYGTHVGVLYYSAEHKTWIVEHNIHGNVHYDALESILGGISNPHKYGVTSISKVSR